MEGLTSALTQKNCENDTALSYFASNFDDRIKDLTAYCSRLKDLPEPTRERNSTLNASVDGSFTEECGHLLSYNQNGCGEFDFSNRFEPEEVEWILNKPYAKGRTALHHEVIHQRVNVLEALLKREGNANVRDEHGQTPVHYAASQGDSTILSLLLNHGGDLYLYDEHGQSPLNLLQSNYSSLYKGVIQKQLSKNFLFGDLQLVEKLHDIVQQCGPLEEFKNIYSQIPSMKKPDYTDLGHQTLLFRACKAGWLDGVSFLLLDGKEVPCANRITNETPLHAACEGNHYEIVKQLITMFPQLLLVKDKLPYRGWYPIHTACAYGASDKVLEAILVGMLCLIEICKDGLNDVCFLDVHSQSPLYIAAKCGNLSHIILMTLPFLVDTLQNCVPSLYAFTSGNLSRISIIHYAIAHDRKELMHVVLDSLPSAAEVSAYPSIFSLTHMVTRMQEINNSLDTKPIIFPVLKSTICESSDAKLFLTTMDVALDEYGVLSNLMLSPLAMAVAMGNAELTRTLLDAGSMDDGGLALRLAIFLQHLDIAKTILTASNISSICEGSGKKLFVFPFSVDQLSSFTEIYLQKNSLSSISQALFHIAGLKVLDVSYNLLTELPDFWNCPNLKTLDISNNKFTSLPSFIWTIPSLSHIYAQRNTIGEIDPPQNCSVTFKEIDLSNNKLSTVPLCIFHSKIVNISFNKIEKLPAPLWRLEELNTLNVSNNIIEQIDFPKSLCSWKFESQVSFTSKGRRALTTDGRIEKHCVPKSKHGGLLKLNLANNKLSSFPDDLACFAYQLLDLNISGNIIRTMYICLLPPCLKQLTAKECQLKYFGTDCGVVKHSSHCYHKSHMNLEKLTVLKLNKNDLGMLNFVSSLDASGNTLKFPELDFLDLSDNDLCGALDNTIKYQRYLTALYLGGNPRLMYLPLELSYLSDNLSTLVLDNLPQLIDPPKEYHSAPTKRLLSYLKSRVKSSVPYHELSIMVVGDPKTGKTSLIKIPTRKGSRHKHSSRINIHTWKYSPCTKAKAVTFKIWDFPSKNYSEINHCFYSKRAIYVVTLNLLDGTSGAIELDKYLRNIRTYAPGCPVIIVGTRLNQISEKEDNILKVITTMYSDRFSYPEIADVCCIGDGDSIYNGADKLKEKIYNVATHLYIARHNILELRLKKPPNDPDALLQQKIPKSYLILQEEIHKLVLSMEQTNEAPIMNKKEFYELLMPFVEDEEELASAVQFLHCQNVLMHFEGTFLNEFYFLSKQWIFNAIANIMKMPSTNGMVQKDHIITQSAVSIPEDCQAGFLALLAKFDFAIPCNDKYVFVHCLLPKELDSSTKAMTEATKTHLIPNIGKILCKGISNSFSEMIGGFKEFKSKLSEYQDKPRMRMSLVTSGLHDSISEDDLQRDNHDHCDAQHFPNFNIVDSASFETSLNITASMHQSGERQWLRTPNVNPMLHPPLQRVWLAAFIPDGFWPQLLAKIILDNAICCTLSAILSHALQNNEYTLDHMSSSGSLSLWKLSQLGLAIEYDDIRLLELKQITNTCDNTSNKYDLSEQYTYQIELTIHIRNIMLVHKLETSDEAEVSKAQVIRLATRILVMIEQHLMDIGEEWFPGTISDARSHQILSFVPCPLCVSENDDDTSYKDCSGQWFLQCSGHKVVCFGFKSLLNAYALPSRSVECPLHGDILVQQLAPDMCFKDLEEDIICGPEIPLTIDKNKELGSGGSALVLRGEIKCNNIRKLVAVKIINQGPKRAKSLTEFLKNYTTSLESYREIRKEVSFLATLHHENLTQLSGISINPYMLLIELAPLGSLGSILKQYKTASKILSPVLLQASMLQIASALAFLHSKHVVYLDMKSDNVLAWKFPLPGHQNTNQDVLLKITDYGISRMSSSTNEIRNSSITGTPGFIAPEVYTGKHQDLQSDKIDVFAFGMYVYELLTLLKPFELQSDSAEGLIRKNQRPQIPASSKENFTPYLIQQIMQCCWRQDPKERPTMAQVVKWSKLDELKSLRTILSLQSKELLCVCQCHVNHVIQNAAEKPLNIYSTLPNCNSYTPLLFSMHAQSPLAKGTCHKAEDSSHQHIQIWVAQGDSSGTKLTIVTFRSYDLGYWVYEDSATAKVQAMINVHNSMWVSTKDKLHVIDTAAMKTISCVVLENSTMEVTHMLHVPEWHMVLLLWELSELWCLHDKVTASGVHVIGKLQLDRNISIVSLCKVKVRGTTEVWVTRKDKDIVVLAQSQSGCCEKFILSVPEKSLYYCDLITCLNFSTATEKYMTHIWVSFHRKEPKLVCWDGEEKSHLQTISLKSDQHATSLLGHDNHLYVGTSAGTVEVYESESGDLLQLFSWHAAGVMGLMELPPEIKQSIYAECSSARCLPSTHQSLVKNEIVPYQRVCQESCLQRNTYALSRLKLIHKSVTYSDAPLMVSIGNGLAESVKINCENKSHDTILFTWSGIPSA